MTVPLVDKHGDHVLLAVGEEKEPKLKGPELIDHAFAVRVILTHDEAIGLLLALGQMFIL